MSVRPRHERCHGCGREFRISDMTAIVILTAKQTHWEPAEYSDAYLCSACDDEDQRDPDYERACLKFKEEQGHEL